MKLKNDIESKINNLQIDINGGASANKSTVKSQTLFQKADDHPKLITYYCDNWYDCVNFEIADAAKN